MHKQPGGIARANRGYRHENFAVGMCIAARPARPREGQAAVGQHARLRRRRNRAARRTRRRLLPAHRTV